MSLFGRAFAWYIVLALLAGVAWNWLATPAETVVTAQGIVLTEVAAMDRFGVIVVYVAAGAVVSLVWGVGFGRAAAARGWVIVPFAVLSALVAAAVALWLGVQLGPPDPTTLDGLVVGDTPPQRLDLDAVTPLFAWPALAVLGLIAGVWSHDDPSPGDVGDSGFGERDEVVGR